MSYLSFDWGHFAVQPALTDRLGVALGRRIATGRHRGLVHLKIKFQKIKKIFFQIIKNYKMFAKCLQNYLFAKQRSYTLYARGVAGCAICGLRGTKR